MAQKVTKTDPKSYENLINTPTEDILKQVKSHDIEVLPADREQFLKFARLNPTERAEFIKAEFPAPEGSDNSSLSGDTGDTSDTGAIDGSKPSGDGTPADTAQSGDDGSSPDSGDYLVQIDKLQAALNKQRAKNGETGQKVKALTEQLVETQKKLKELEENPPEPPKIVEMPEVPALPDPEKYVQGTYDDEYKSAMENYQSELKDYSKKLKEYVNSSKPDWVKEIEDNLAEIQKKADAAHSFSENTLQEQVTTRADQAYQSMWSDVKEMQKLTGLDTKVSVDIINNSQKIVNAKDVKDGAGNPVYSDEEISSAQSVLSSLPAGDYDKYKKVVRIVSNQYGFDESGVPYKKMDLDSDLAWTAAIRKAGLTDVKMIIPNPPKSGDIAQRLSDTQNQQSASPNHLSGSDLGANEQLGQPTTTQEKQEKLLDMSKRINANRSLLNDKVFMQGFEKLRSELGLAKK